MEQNRQIPTTLNLILSAAISAVILAKLLVLPVLTNDIWIMLAVVLVLVPLNTPYWSLIHEAIHNNLHPDRRTNQMMGRAMSVLFGAGYPILRFGHLMHHQYNREWESEYYDTRKQPRWRAALNHYFKMLGGLYLIEVVTSFALALAPRALVRKLDPYLFEDERHRQAVTNSLLKPKTLRTLRIDCAAIAVLYAAAFILYGAYWFVLAAMIMGRALIISLMDNAYHYDTPPDNSVAAKELKLPKVLAAFVLNFNHHLTHHNDTAVPWNGLRDAHASQGNRYTEGLGTAVGAQFKGPIRQ